MGTTCRVAVPGPAPPALLLQKPGLLGEPPALVLQTALGVGLALPLRREPGHPGETPKSKCGLVPAGPWPMVCLCPVGADGGGHAFLAAPSSAPDMDELLGPPLPACRVSRP